MAIVYLLHSKKINKYYIGSCHDINLRLNQHLNKEFSNSFTSKADDWEIIYSKEVDNVTIARKIENHIKNMRSTTYNKNLVKYSEIMDKLIQKYSTGSCR